MTRGQWRVALAIAASGLIVGTTQLAPTSASAQREPVTLTIGLRQDLDSPNVTAGRAPASFELWNLQYARLTDTAVDDFTTIPGLAETWVASNNGLTYTYILRKGLLWSDGHPLTAEDVAWTINTSRERGWLNHAVTGNLFAVPIGDDAVAITSSVPDPRLPAIDAYILPKHVWEGPASGDITSYHALDGVGSGPFTLQAWTPGDQWTMVANPNYWQGAAAIDQVVFRLYADGAVMAQALDDGQIDAARDLPVDLFAEMRRRVFSPDLRDGIDGIVAVAGEHGAFTALGMNSMTAGIGDGHPALLDIDVRHAIAQAIDRDALLETVALGIGARSDTISVSPNREWDPEIPVDQQLNFDPAAANVLLDSAGYLDTDGDGVREMPDGSRPLTLRYAELSDNPHAAGIRELVTQWLADVGIATEVSVFDIWQLAGAVKSGEFDLFVTSWTPSADPDAFLSLWTCDQLGFCNSEYDALYAEQSQELDHNRRVEIVHQMLTLLHNDATLVALFRDADTEAYRTDRFEGWQRQPADVGPVLFTNSPATIYNLKLLPTDEPDFVGDGLSPVFVVVLIVFVVAIIGAPIFMGMRSRTRRANR